MRKAGARSGGRTERQRLRVMKGAVRPLPDLRASAAGGRGAGGAGQRIGLKGYRTWRRARSRDSFRQWSIVTL